MPKTNIKKSKPSGLINEKQIGNACRGLVHMLFEDKVTVEEVKTIGRDLECGENDLFVFGFFKEKGLIK